MHLNLSVYYSQQHASKPSPLRGRTSLRGDPKLNTRGILLFCQLAEEVYLVLAWGLPLVIAFECRL